MKSLYIIVVLTIFFNCIIFPQSDIERQVKKIADLILEGNMVGIKSASTGNIITDYSKLPAEGMLVIASPYRNWYYVNGVLNIAMLEMYKQFRDVKYMDYTLGNYHFVFDNYILFERLVKEGRFEGMAQHWNITYLDNCGAMAAGLLEAYKIENRKDYLSYFDIVSDYILNKEHRLADGTLARIDPYDKTVWLDDLYMSVPFLARMGNLTGDRKYFDFAARQIIQFTRYLYDENSGLYFHCYYDDIKTQGVAHWGRANGWSIVAQSNLLEFLPKDHPDRPELIRIFKKQLLGFAKYQSESGLWHQILDREDSYLETSCTAMFTYAVAKAVNEGWIEPRFKSIALEGWKGISTMINEKGEVENICIGTGTSTDMIHYYKRPVITNDIHGLGAVLLAGVEVLKLPVK